MLPDHVGPEVVAMDSHAVAWQHVTHSFGEPYGAQRGGVEVSVCGPDDAQVRIDVRGPVGPDRAGRAGRTPGPRPVRARRRRRAGPALALQPAVGALLGLGVRELDVSFRDDDRPRAAFYYARAFQVDGELAWSSPIWVGPPSAAVDTCS